MGFGMISLLIPGIGSFTPSSLSTGTLLQRLDSLEYKSTTIGGLPVLEDRSRTGDARKPRQKRVWNFDGVDDVATAGAKLTTSQTQLSVLIEVCTTAAGAGNYYCLCGEDNSTGNQRGWSMHLRNGKLTVIISGDGSTVAERTSTETFNDGDWHTLGFFYDQGELVLYSDGTPIDDDEVVMPAAIFNTTAVFKVGANHATSNSFSGKLVPPRVYSGVVKTSAEMLAIFNQAAHPTVYDTTGLVALWPGEEEAGTSGYDCLNATPKNLTLSNITAATFHATDSTLPHSFANEYGHSVSGTTIIPRSLADPTKDAAGDSVNFTGQCPHYAIAPPSCLKGDGTSIWASAGGFRVPPTSDWTISLLYRHSTSNTTRRTILAQNTGTIAAFALEANAGGTSAALGYRIGNTAVATISSALVAGEWHRIVLSRTGNDYSLSCEQLETNPGVILTASGANATELAEDQLVFLSAMAYFVLRPSDGAIADVRITVPSYANATYIVPFQNQSDVSGA